MRSRLLLWIHFLIWLPAIMLGADDPEITATYEHQQTNAPILVDGILSEDIWASLPVADNFWMSYPVDDRRVESNRRTEVRVTSDAQFLYIAAVCYGTDDYVIKTLKRDAEFWDGDGFGVVIDPVNEKTNGFAFGVSPAGVQTEFLVEGYTSRRRISGTGSSSRSRRGINLAWDDKWFCEVSNHPDHWIAEIAIPFKTLRFNQAKSAWGINFFRRDAGSNSVHTWVPVPIEFNEYDLSYTGTLRWDEPPERSRKSLALIPYVRGSTAKDHIDQTPRENDLQAGLDIKLPVTSSLNLDLTVNPDFSQVEVDEQVVNLTLFDIRLPEKRVFFLENSDVFDDFGIPPMRPFFSRRIGLDDDGNGIPILYGARLSGNVNQDLRLGVMNLQTRETADFSAQNYTVASFHQKVLSRSVIKGYFHNRDALRAEQADYNRNAGAEFQYRSENGRFRTFGGFAKSFTPGLKKRDYFYNTGIGYNNRNISYYTNISGLGRNYRADLGYIRGQEYYDAVRDTTEFISFHHYYTRFGYTFYPEGNDRIISHAIDARHIYDGDSTLSILNNEVEAGYTLQFASTARIRLNFAHETVKLLFPFDFVNDVPLPAGIYSFGRMEMDLQTDQRRRFSLTGQVSYGQFYNGTRGQYTLGLKYRAQPWGNFAVSFEQNTLQFPDPYGHEMIWLVSPRIEINFSRSLFWTTFLQYNTRRDNFNINSRLQWRYQPMSDLYIVYTDNYALEVWGPKHRALAIKLNYWFNL